MAVFRKWLVLKDETPIYATLGTVAANYLIGDPVWLGIVGPPSSAKTEILNSASLLPKVHSVAILTVGALLSGVPKKDRSGGSKGGLLREIGEFGIIACKDLGSVLSMPNDTRIQVLAALREIFDGAWSRGVGSDGGRMLHWKGKAGFIFAATAALDAYHAVIGSLGDRWLLSRLEPVKKGQLKIAAKHHGATAKQMRRELAETVAELLDERSASAREIDDNELAQLDDVVSLLVRLRGAVERDRHSREVENVLGAEGTARVGLSLIGLLAGLDSIGIDRTLAFDVIKRVALDSVPPIRRRAYEAVCNYDPAVNKERAVEDGPADTGDIALELGLPTNTVRRALEDLQAHGLIRHFKVKHGEAHKWMKCPWEAED
jgi:hypothetical protein